MTGSQKTYSADDVVIDLTLIPFYRNLTGAFQLRSVMIIPLIVRNRGIGEILLGNRESGFFDENDLGLMATSASQLAAAIEKSRLYAQTEESLQRRVEQLLALTHVSQKLITSLNLEQLIRVIYDELLRTSQADCGSIFYFNYGLNPIRKQTVTISVGDPREVELLFVEQHGVQSGMPIIVGDYSQMRCLLYS